MAESEEQEWVRVATLEELPPGRSMLFSYQGDDIAIFNADGEIYAIGDTCTHAETSLSDGEFFEDIRGWVVECPLHGSQFDLTTGTAVSLPATGTAGRPTRASIPAMPARTNTRPARTRRRPSQVPLSLACTQAPAVHDMVAPVTAIPATTGERCRSAVTASVT